jgi:serine/threonine protein kinase
VLPGSGVSGKIAGYQLEECIGEGEAAVVRLARDERLDRTVAVKIIAPELAGDAAFRARFLSESRAAAAMGHRHVVPVYGAGDAGGILYVAMRHAGGGDARSLLSRRGPLPLAWAGSVIVQVASALDAAHGHGLLHRDVKPANMLLDADSQAGGRTPDRAGGSGLGHVYLSDFGMGRDLSPSEIIAAGQFAPALDYLAPEQIQGCALDGRADLYSLACAGFELLCGAPPFGQDQGLTVMYAQMYAPPPAATARRPELPAAVDRVLATALAKNPADRYPTCGQFAEELRTALRLSPGGPDDPARLRSRGRARSVAESRPPSSQERPAGQHESGHEPAHTPAPVRSEPGRPPPPEGKPAAGPVRPRLDALRRPGRPSRQPRHRSGLIGLIVALAVIGIANAVAIGVVWSAKPKRGRAAVPSPSATSGRSSSATPSPSSASALASGQAAAISDLLSSSAATRKALQGAISQAGGCTDLSSAVSQIQNVVNQRSTEYQKASALSTSALTDGTIVKTDLTAALRSSLDADKDYLAWAKRQLRLGCAPATQSSAYNAAYKTDEQANAAKEAFIQVWNPVAAQYGIQQESPGSI